MFFYSFKIKWQRLTIEKWNENECQRNMTSLTCNIQTQCHHQDCSSLVSSDSIVWWYLQKVVSVPLFGSGLGSVPLLGTCIKNEVKQLVWEVVMRYSLNFLCHDNLWARNQPQIVPPHYSVSWRLNIDRNIIISDPSTMNMYYIDWF
jgi:hypothetical protein